MNLSQYILVQMWVLFIFFTFTSGTKWNLNFTENSLPNNMYPSHFLENEYMTIENDCVRGYTLAIPNHRCIFHDFVFSEKGIPQILSVGGMKYRNGKLVKYIRDPLRGLESFKIENFNDTYKLTINIVRREKFARILWITHRQPHIQLPITVYKSGKDVIPWRFSDDIECTTANDYFKNNTIFTNFTQQLDCISSTVLHYWIVTIGGADTMKISTSSQNNHIFYIGEIITILRKQDGTLVKISETVNSSDKERLVFYNRNGTISGKLISTRVNTEYPIVIWLYSETYPH